MTALAANKTGLKFKDISGTSRGATAAVPIYDTADTVYANAAMSYNPFSGKYQPIGTGNFLEVFAGISEQEVVYSASSSLEHPVNISGQVIESLAVNGATSADDRDKTVYLSTDNVADSTLTWTVGAVPIGRVYNYVSTGVCDVRLFTPDEAAIAAGLQADGTWIRKMLAVTLSGVSNGDVSTDLVTFGGAGSITEFWWETTTATSDSDAATTLNAEINTTNLTGGVISLGDTGDAVTVDGAGLTQNYGATISSTKITAANAFTSGDTLSIEAASTTAYSDGAGDLYMRFSG